MVAGRNANNFLVNLIKMEPMCSAEQRRDLISVWAHTTPKLNLTTPFIWTRTQVAKLPPKDAIVPAGLWRLQLTRLALITELGRYTKMAARGESGSVCFSNFVKGIPLNTATFVVRLMCIHLHNKKSSRWESLATGAVRTFEPRQMSRPPPAPIRNERINKPTQTS